MATVDKMDPIMISIKDGTQLLGIGRTRIYELIGECRIQAKKDGKRTLLLMDSLRAYVAGLPPMPRRTGQGGT